MRLSDEAVNRWGPPRTDIEHYFPMGTALLIPLVLSIFLVRDHLLLRMGPRRTTFVRLRAYAISLLMSGIVAAASTFALEPSRLLRTLLAPAVALPVVLFYGVLAIACIWVRRTDNHHFAWYFAVVPNPLLALGFAMFARLALASAWPYAVIVVALLLACLWIGLIVVSVWWTRNTPLDVPDLDFSLGLAAIVNSVALILLPLALIVDSTAWSDLFRRLASFD